MSLHPTTQCRVCGAELKPSWWRALVGLDDTTCVDPVGCVTRFRVTREATWWAGPSSAAS